MENTKKTEKAMEKTLGELLKMYAKAPKMRMAILRAIEDHGPLALACVVNGIPSKSHNSSCYRAAKARGWHDYAIYQGARCQFKCQGYFSVIVALE